MAVADRGVTRMRAPERRSQLVHIAAALFHRRGYHGVSLEAVAAEAGLTGPAVYRHFRNKQALLAAAISSGLDPVEDALLRATGGTLDELVTAVAGAGTERPDMWVLLQRESRYLEPDLRTHVDAQFARVIAGFVQWVRAESPGLTEEDARLLVTAAMAVLSSPAMSTTALPRAEYRRELSAAALSCLRFDLDDVPAVPPMLPPVAAPSGSRRDDIVDAATELFYRRGYPGVSLDDIGAAVGMAGPSLLHYFSTKSDILVAAFDRAAASRDPSSRAIDPEAGLDRLVDSYVRFCLQNRSLVGVYVSDATSMPADSLRRTRDVIRSDVAAWSTAVRTSTPGLDARRAGVRVSAAMAAIHDLVRLGHLADRPSIVGEAAALALAVLVR